MSTKTVIVCDGCGDDIIRGTVNVRYATGMRRRDLCPGCLAWIRQEVQDKIGGWEWIFENFAEAPVSEPVDKTG